MPTTESISPSKFRADFPEFANAATFPDGQIVFWSKLASRMINEDRFGGDLEMVDLMLELFIAHNVALEAYNFKAAQGGGVPGISRGIIASAAGGAVNVSYDTTGASEADAGHWNLTVYGTRFINWIKMFGAGPVQVGTPFLAGVVVGTGIGIVCGPGWGYYSGAAGVL
jgi:hypothetical protein